MTDTVLTALVSAVAGFVVGGFFLDGAADVVAVVGGVTVLSAATARYGAVLARRGERAVKRITAIGFFAGLGISIVILLADAIWG